MNGAPLRVAAVLDSLQTPAWVAQVLLNIKAAAFAELTSVVTGDSVPCQPAPAHPGNSALFRRYAAWDRSRHSSELDPLLPVDLSTELAGIPAVDWTAVSADVVLWFSSCAPVGLDSEAARFGVWFYQTGEGVCFWELYNHQPVTSSSLAVLHGPKSVPAVIAEQSTATKIGWSLSRNRTVSYWKAPSLILKSLRSLQERSPASVLSLGANSLPSKLFAAAQTVPSNTQMAQFFIRNATRTIYRHIRYFGQHGYWFMAYRTDRRKFVSQTESFHPHGFTTIAAPDGHFYADPFVWTQAGRNFIFFEDYPYREGKGVISVLEIDARGPAGEARRVLERPYHLSYPFVFEHEGSVYMIPETFDAHRVELYRASHFPDVWELAAVLKEDVDAVDTTLWVQNGIFYFFTSIAEKGTTPNDSLHLYCADSLTGPWHPHPDNPLNSDVRSSRGAGKLFQRGGKLIRPSQDCSVRYGYAIQLNEIKMLSPDRYLESPLSRIEPNWMPGLIGTHTIDSNEWIEVIDGQIYKNKFRNRH